DVIKFMLSPMFLFMFKLINKNKAARKSHEKTKRIAFKIAFFFVLCQIITWQSWINQKQKQDFTYHISGLTT
ncbi:hypothetical protein, partial [Acinetobacter colistiniresistens]|uniref:hypothetical protein n=1 Tax=Acinetobacter colistiniresistens TaxID=280145 RepID=UPI002FE39FE8